MTVTQGFMALLKEKNLDTAVMKIQKNPKQNRKKKPLGLLFPELHIKHFYLQGFISAVISAGRTELQTKSGTAAGF